MGRTGELVERFYHELWNRAEESVAFEILAPDFRFRGSLGPEQRGPEGFLGYHREVHAALGDYRCHIVTLVEDGPRAAARMRFTGIHRGRFFGVEPTGRPVEWAGAAFFEAAEGKIASLWVLGDVDGLKARLGAQPEAGFG